MSDVSLLPPADHYQYFSHLFHSKTLISYEKYLPNQIPNWPYPSLDLKRFQKLFLEDLNYVKDCKILDLGCHIGYMSYIAKYLGAKSVHGVNSRKFPLTIANYAFSQLGVTDFKFEQHNIEDLDFLKSACQDKDTVILTQVLEYMKNPYALLETISKSDIKNIIFESSLLDDISPAKLDYYFQSTESDFIGYDNNPDKKIRIRFSLMPQELSNILEPNTSLISERIDAINDFYYAGYDVHINFSPIIMNPGVKKLYEDLFKKIDYYVDDKIKENVFAECIMLTHNDKMHLYNLEHNSKAEELLWCPDRQESKISSFGSKNIRYKVNLKEQYIKDFVKLHDEIIPWNKIRYIF